LTLKVAPKPQTTHTGEFSLIPSGTRKPVTSLSGGGRFVIRSWNETRTTQNRGVRTLACLRGGLPFTRRSTGGRRQQHLTITAKGKVVTVAVTMRQKERKARYTFRDQVLRLNKDSASVIHFIVAKLHRHTNTQHRK